MLSMNLSVFVSDSLVKYRCFSNGLQRYALFLYLQTFSDFFHKNFHKKTFYCVKYTLISFKKPPNKASTTDLLRTSLFRTSGHNNPQNPPENFLYIPKYVLKPYLIIFVGPTQ